jgi:Rrf2 family protein
MRISAKGRYALASIISMAQDYGKGECITVISISEKLGISKIYLEQVFSLLKRGGIVSSIKGAQGGYMLTRTPDQLSVFDVLSAVEGTLFEVTEETVSKKAPAIDMAMRILVFDALDESVKTSLSKISLTDLVQETEKHGADNAYMFFI